MSSLRWTYSRDSLTVSVDNEKPVMVRGAKAQELLQEIQLHESVMDAQMARDIFNRAQGNILERVARISDRKIVQAMTDAGIRNIGYSSGKVTFANKPIRGAIGRHLMRVIERNEMDLERVNWTSLANFFNRLESNPSASEQLFHWLSVNDFSIASDGRVICYKGVHNDYTSSYAGVGGWITESGDSFYSPTTDLAGYMEHKTLQYAPGNTVYMRRQDCDPDSNTHCSTGVHFGTQSYADDWGAVTMLCLVDPEDVVSIPNDDYRKARASRIEVVGELSRRGLFVEEPIVEFREDESGVGPALYDATNAGEIDRKLEIDFNGKDD